MARTYSRATHRPAVLFYSETGKLLVAAVGSDLPVTAYFHIGLHGAQLRDGLRDSDTSEDAPRPNA